VMMVVIVMMMEVVVVMVVVVVITMIMLMTGDWSSETDMVTDGAAERLTKQYPVTTSTTCYGGHYSGSINGYNNAAFGVAGSAVADTLMDGQLRTSSSGAMLVGPPLSVACPRLDLDPSAAASVYRRRCSDAGVRQQTSDVGGGGRCTVDRVTDMPPPAVPPPLPAGGPAAGRLFSGVIGPRSAASNTVLHAAAAASTPSRVRGGAVLAKSCGNALLRRAASPPVHPARSPVSAAAAPRSRGTSTSGGGAATHHSSARVSGIRSSLSSSQLSDVRGGAGRIPSYLALDDHRYTLRVPPPPANPQPPPSKVQKTAGSRSSSSAMRQSASSGNLVGVTSILEAFLRSTQLPRDPNKGSNAALAAAGLSHLPLLGAHRAGAARPTAADDAVDDDASGTLLKKLLTGEIDQSAVQRGAQKTSSAAETVVSDIQTASKDFSTTSAVDAMLAEGFGFEGAFYVDDDAQNITLSLLDDVADDGLWMTAGTDDFDDTVGHSQLSVFTLMYVN